MASDEPLKLKQLDQQIISTQTALSAAKQKLHKNTALYRTTHVNQQAMLANLMRSAYRLRQQSWLKLVLSQSDTSKMSRLLMYYHYINQSQLAVLTQLQQTAQALQGSISHQQQQLHDLLTHKKLLEQTIRQLDLDTTKQLQTINTTDFSAQKGGLFFPTQGKILSLFGTQIGQSELKWDGILIAAAQDQPVYAIADGQVIFAKWLPGYGLILIISHGHGYMTLYGRNHNLYKKPGDIVRRGDLIATVGDGGGYPSPALYFAIRHNAIPQNPLLWCHQRN